MLIDTHCHLNDERAFPDPSEAIREALDAGVRYQIVIGVQPDDWTRAIALAERFESVYAVVGYHPNYTVGFDPSLSALRSALAHPRVVALGEIGLDYHWDDAPADVQMDALVRQLDLATEAKLPVVFHCREAYGDLLDILESRPPHPYLLHCFGGSIADAERAIALGCLFGVDGPVTYKKADSLRETLASIGVNRLLLETDSPYMPPEPHRGKPNRPAWIPLINAGLAKALNVPETECAAVTTANALRFFGLDR